MAYHVIEETGKIDICRSKTPNGCPYKHFDTLADAVHYVEENKIYLRSSADDMALKCRGIEGNCLVSGWHELHREEGGPSDVIGIVQPLLPKELRLALYQSGEYSPASKITATGLEIYYVTGLSQEGIRHLIRTGEVVLPVPEKRCSTDTEPIIIVTKGAFAKANIKADVQSVISSQGESLKGRSATVLIEDGAFEGQDMLREVELDGMRVEYIGKDAFKGTNLISYVAMHPEGNSVTVTADEKPFPDTLRVLYSDKPMWKNGKLPYYENLENLMIPYNTVKKEYLDQYKGQLTTMMPVDWGADPDETTNFLDVKKIKQLADKGYVTWYTKEKDLLDYAKYIDLNGTEYITSMPFSIDIAKGREDEEYTEADLQRKVDQRAREEIADSMSQGIHNLINIFFGKR